VRCWGSLLLALEQTADSARSEAVDPLIDRVLQDKDENVRNLGISMIQKGFIQCPKPFFAHFSKIANIACMLASYNNNMHF